MDGERRGRERSGTVGEELEMEMEQEGEKEGAIKTVESSTSRINSGDGVPETPRAESQYKSPVGGGSGSVLAMKSVVLSF